MLFGYSSRYLLFLLVALLRYYGTCAQQLKSKTVDDGYIYYPHQPDGIQYHPAWGTDNGDPNRMDRTYHRSTQPNADLIYFFQGDAIYYYGDRGPNNHAPAMVYIDGDNKGDMVLSNSSSTQYQQLLWSKANLGPGDHQIVISNAGSGGQVMGLDYLVIESDHGFTSAGAGPAASSIPSEAIIVDDNDPNVITYIGWDKIVYPSRGRFFYYKNTMHRTNQPGSFLTFKFNGTAVWYIAGLFPDNGMMNITLDNESAVMINGSSGSNASLTQRIIWNATELPNREHTVVIKHQDIAGLHVTLDYFRYMSSVPQPASRASPPIPVIVGSTLGAAALLALSIVWYMLIRRRRTSNVTIDDQSNSNHLNEGPRPLFNPTNQAMSQPLSLQPHWGYVTEPYTHQIETSSSFVSNNRIMRSHKIRPSDNTNRLAYVPAANTLCASASSMPSHYGSEVTRSEPGLDRSEEPPTYDQINV
ncbi:unnamed protein product [Rhizoctonia solani]|uniref:Transmembrane protein n=1 Tax=Rhizoctonia solani TaxID=456999 RepID=A0A8H3AFU5_9AGAM|nr:unnamed protein product [Rhizoctonia solani]